MAAYPLPCLTDPYLWWVYRRSLFTDPVHNLFQERKTDTEVNEKAFGCIRLEKCKWYESIGDKCASMILYMVLKKYNVPFIWWQKFTELFTSDYHWERMGKVVDLPDWGRFRDSDSDSACAFEVCSPQLSRLSCSFHVSCFFMPILDFRGSWLEKRLMKRCILVF